MEKNTENTEITKIKIKEKILENPIVKLAIWFKNSRKSLKIICFIVASIVLVDIGIGFFLIGSRGKSSVFVEDLNGGQSSQLISLDSGARKGKIKGNGSADFLFTDEQKKTFEKIYEEFGSCGLVVRLEIQAEKSAVEKPVLRFGFISDQDLINRKKNNKYNAEEGKKISISADLKKMESCFDLSMALPKGNGKLENVPAGFFVVSDEECRILSACIVPAQIGFDKSESVPFFGFSSNGGIVDASCSSVDFSSASETFFTENTAYSKMPEIQIIFSPDEDKKSVSENNVFVKLNAGGELISIKNVKNTNSLVIPSSALKMPFVLTDIAENKECVLAILMKNTETEKEALFESNASEVFIPIRTDPGLIVKYPKKNWRVADYEIFEWDRYPGILFFDTRNYDIQDNFFRRMAFFVEKQSFKGRILTNEELKGKHGYNAHDYRPESMAEFFNAADKKGIKLNREEETLRKILLQNGLLIKDGNRVKAGHGAVVSISQESGEALRTQLLAHEGWHTIFFTDEDFRNYVAAVYYTVDADSLQFLVDYFKSQTSLGYDTDDDYLMKNEFMAYIMQQRVSAVGDYFVAHAKWGSVQKYTKELADYVIRTKGQAFEDAALILNDYVFDKYGIECGSINLVRR